MLGLPLPPPVNQHLVFPSSSPSAFYKYCHSFLSQQSLQEEQGTNGQHEGDQAGTSAAQLLQILSLA